MEPTWRLQSFNEEQNKENMKADLDLIQEVRKVAHSKEYAVKIRAERRYNSNVFPQNMKEGNLVLRKAMRVLVAGNLAPN
ncbi:Retrotransposable element Tf2 [Sesbania bispinosa]|nr:Retrotransposable element Tf2 [Sesbania bispinosa]